MLQLPPMEAQQAPQAAVVIGLNNQRHGCVVHILPSAQDQTLTHNAQRLSTTLRPLPRLAAPRLVLLLHQILLPSLRQQALVGLVSRQLQQARPLLSTLQIVPMLRLPPAITRWRSCGRRGFGSTRMHSLCKAATVNPRLLACRVVRTLLLALIIKWQTMASTAKWTQWKTRLRSNTMKARRLEKRACFGP